MDYELKCTSKRVKPKFIKKIKRVISEKVSPHSVSVLITDISREADEHDERPIASITILMTKESTRPNGGVILSYPEDLENHIKQALEKFN